MGQTYVENPTGHIGDDAHAHCDAFNWDRLVSERETTAAALSAALQHLASLEREAEELQQEKVAKEGHGRGELNGIRATLRRLARPTMAAMSRARPRMFKAPDLSTASSSSAPS